MRLLFISVGGPPKTNAESLQVSMIMKGLLKQEGIEVIWLTEDVAQETQGWQMVGESYTSLLNQIEIIELGNNQGLLTKIKRRLNIENSFPDNKSFLLKGLTQNIVESLMGKRIDIIYSRSSPITSHALALQLKPKLNVPWVAHFSDPWAYSPLSETSNREKEYEALLMQAIDFCYVTNVRTQALMKQQYPDVSMGVLPNLYDTISNRDNSTSKRFKIVHAGNFYQSRSPKSLLDAICELTASQQKEVELHLLGFMIPAYQEMVERYQKKISIVVHGGVTYKTALLAQENANLLVSIDPELSPEQSVFLPSKIVTYMAMGIPILAFCHQEAPSYNLVHNVFGTCHTFNQSKDASKTIAHYLDFWKKDEQPKLPSPNKEYFADYQAQELLKLLLNLKQ